MRHLRFAVLVLPALIASDLLAGGGARTAKALATITEPEIRAHVEFLASDELEGRATGTPGFDAAARYIATRIEAYGLRPLGEGGSFYQPLKAGKRSTQNVAGLVEGTDPALRGEVLILGAHLDHVGTGSFGSLGRKGEIHNGADDNASGSSTILELAEAFALFPPRRSVLFLWFAGEEIGLVGSRHYVNNPLLPLERTVAMINLDMVGRSKDDYLFIGGVGTSPDLRALCEAANADLGFKIEWGTGGNAPSDNAAFYRKKLPVLFFFTNVHEDYHRPGDDAEKINYEGAGRIARMVYRVAEEIADRDERPAFTPDDGFSLPESMRRGLTARGGPSRRNRAFLGVVPAEEGAARGFRIGEVVEGSAAEEAGLRAGDVIVGFGEKAVEKDEDLIAAIDAAKPDEEVTLRVLREGAEIEVRAKLGRPRRNPE